MAINLTVKTIQVKRGKKESWATKNPTLLKGEPGYEIDTHKLKVGDGTAAWNDLPYVDDEGQAIPNETIDTLFE